MYDQSMKSGVYSDAYYHDFNTVVLFWRSPSGHLNMNYILMVGPARGPLMIVIDTAILIIFRVEDDVRCPCV